ncbi:CmcJ/NvfI family oxidoreductase [Novosphingobium bradum]|uniref:CmcJ/NvfI family oxidoreductase n=1 Tax=Novosphingobium bradum TaxID=1737444 RepID=A0ABV7IQQ7_9SPHN
MSNVVTPSIKATVNYQADRAGAGVYSTWTPELTSLKLKPVETRVVDMRALSPAPTLQREGFALVDHAVTGDWADKAWLESAYVESCVELARRVTGAPIAFPMYFPVLRSSDPSKGVDPAGFLHIDQPRDTYFPQVEAKAKELGHTIKRAAIINVWKAITPPPQDRPLAIADIRAVKAEDHVRGLNVEQGGDNRRINVDFVGIAVPDEPLTLYYAPEMTIGQSLVFVGADFDWSHPEGCAHTAVAVPDAPGLVARQSVEQRIVVIYE